MSHYYTDFDSNFKLYNRVPVLVTVNHMQLGLILCLSCFVSLGQMKVFSRFTSKEIQVLKLRCSQCPNEIVPLTELINIDDKEKSKRTAAVLIPLCNYQGVPSVIFTLRSSTVGTHKGQVSFPGGHINEGESAMEAAIRETQEELGPDIGEIEILGQCQTVPAITGTMVTPFIGFLSKDFLDHSAFSPNPDEVERVFIRSLETLTNPEYRTFETFERNGRIVTLPVFGAHEKEERIWGLTAFILDGVLNNIVHSDAK